MRVRGTVLAVVLAALLAAPLVAAADGTTRTGATPGRLISLMEPTPVHAAGPSAMTARRQVYLSIGGRWQYRPWKVRQSADFYMDHMKWRTWGGPTARGTGLGELFDSDTMSYVPYPIVVRLRRIRACRGGYIYTRIEWTFTGSSPEGFGQSGVNPYVSWCRK